MENLLQCIHSGRSRTKGLYLLFCLIKILYFYKLKITKNCINANPINHSDHVLPEM